MVVDPDRARIALLTVDFAVIIPTPGRPSLLVQALESLRRQTHPASEIVVVLDGPDEPTRLALRDYDGFVSIIEQEHAGTATARNTGIAATTSRWITFLDDDDLWHPDRLQATVQFLEAHPDCCACNAGEWVFAEASAAEPGDLVAETLDECLAQVAMHPGVGHDISYIHIEGRSYELLLARNRGVISTATVDRATCLSSGGFPDGQRAEDWRFFVRVARFAEWQSIDRRLAFRRRHRLNTTTVSPDIPLSGLNAIREIWSEPGHASTPHPPLAAYGREYRQKTQDAVWDALRKRHFASAGQLARVGWQILPRWRDRLYAATPPPFTWRLDRLRNRRRPAARATP